MEFEIYVGNLPKSTTQDELNTLFTQAGEVTAVNLIKDRKSGQSNGFAFIKMSAQNEADKAVIACNGHRLRLVPGKVVKDEGRVGLGWQRGDLRGECRRCEGWIGKAQQGGLVDQAEIAAIGIDHRQGLEAVFAKEPGQIGQAGSRGRREDVPDPRGQALGEQRVHVLVLHPPSGLQGDRR